MVEKEFFGLRKEQNKKDTFRCLFYVGKLTQVVHCVECGSQLVSVIEHNVHCVEYQERAYEHTQEVPQQEVVAVSELVSWLEKKLEF